MLVGARAQYQAKPYVAQNYQNTYKTFQAQPVAYQQTYQTYQAAQPVAYQQTYQTAQPVVALNLKPVAAAATTLSQASY